MKKSAYAAIVFITAASGIVIAQRMEMNISSRVAPATGSPTGDVQITFTNKPWSDGLYKVTYVCATWREGKISFNFGLKSLDSSENGFLLGPGDFKVDTNNTAICEGYIVRLSNHGTVMKAISDGHENNYAWEGPRLKGIAGIPISKPVEVNVP